MRRLHVIASIFAAGLALSAAALADNQSVSDPLGDTPQLKQKPYLDIVRATAGHALGDRLKHKVTMAATLKTEQKNSRPFILINTRGDERSDFEYIVLGRRVFKVNKKDEFIKSGAAQFLGRKRTWVYRFPARAIGNPREYGWAALTSKGKASDLAPNRRYELHLTDSESR